jgi:hypothetical protein
LPAATNRASVYVFDAELVDYPGVGCTIAVRGSQTGQRVRIAPGAGVVPEPKSGARR